MCQGRAPGPCPWHVATSGRDARQWSPALPAGWRALWDLLVTVPHSSSCVGAQKSRSGAFLGAFYCSTAVVVARIRHHTEHVGPGHLLLCAHRGCLLHCCPCRPVRVWFCTSRGTKCHCQATWEQATSS